METINSYIPYLRGYDFTGKVPVIIDFYAAWCGPCKALSPIMEQLAEAYAGKIKVLKVDVDKNQALAAAANIRSIPTLFFIDINGNIERRVGGMPYNMLAQKAQLLIEG
ncbi:thioredoxin [Muribaculum sp.]|uniref:thioredoxin n=1 Tax=Muribaculum sp. TaxID=1918611 RepID=UPI00257AE54D|nr:thioredoxin [Muribaculum sp.]